MIPVLNFIAGICITISVIPQIYKVWKTKRVKDISLLSFEILTFGIALWIVYGMLQHDVP